MDATFATQFPRFLAALYHYVLLLRIWYFCDAVGPLLQNKKKVLRKHHWIQHGRQKRGYMRQ